MQHRHRPVDAPDMLALESALIVDDSKLLLEILSKLFGHHARHVDTALDCAEARVRLAARRYELVLCDRMLPDGDGFEILEETLVQHPDSHFVLMSARWTPDEATRAREAGARGFVPKPVSVDLVARLLGRTEERRRHRRVPVLVAAHLVEGQAPSQRLLAWYVRDLSLHGAFVETRGPLPLGARLALEIGRGNIRARVQAEVVRIQEPSWLYPAGVGVRFEPLDPVAKQTVRTLLAAAEIDDDA